VRRKLMLMIERSICNGSGNIIQAAVKPRVSRLVPGQERNPVAAIQNKVPI
jgi:hypothetical protein